ncbi:Hexuronic acid methyltransferase AglP [Candidatus Bilamarchaeum dharawalense]|uniref:Hexuronic acid methyltransferase AglP n=1 Tax=Candidatus Bilamarchaeum dharawalense TaxID=2885759 RepID=A0A5E4LP26_9ARCH|nr:Hexuronic acid methyltransferase AglP [Candidatus Bilamarchaeum dharawalense]
MFNGIVKNMDPVTRKLQTAARAVQHLDNWGKYLLDCVGLAGTDKVVYGFRDGTRFLVRAGTMDRYVLNEVWFRRCYLPEGFQIKKSDVVVDIGAHIGFFSVMAGQMAREGRVYSFEPNPDNFDLLGINLLMNNLGNVRPIHEAVTDRRGSIELFLSDKNTGGHSIYDYGDRTNRVVVSSTSLQDIVKQHQLDRIDFLKMDCEGAEYEIFRNIPPEVLRLVRKLSMECHYQGEGREPALIVGLLQRNGYVVTVKTDNHLAMIYAKQGEWN